MGDVIRLKKWRAARPQNENHRHCFMFSTHSQSREKTECEEFSED